MASTSTNKQPLLIDRVFHNTVDSSLLVSGSNTSLNITGTNTSAILLDCILNDGGICEDIFAISRGAVAHVVLLYLSSAGDYLRSSEANFVGQMSSAQIIGDVVNLATMPRVLAPQPHVGTEQYFQAMYVPKGKALWATIQTDTAVGDTSPIIGAQGGLY